MNKRLYSLLALLIVGSVSIRAEDSDPFGEVNTAAYQNTMTITGYVRMGGEVLDENTVVAVYQGDELRGKGSPSGNTGKYPHILMMSIFGETLGQPLHFKVYTDGRVIEADQGLTFVSDKRMGMLKDPYYIDLPIPVVTTPICDGWATVCLPYNAEVPSGVTVWIVTGIDADGQLVLKEVEGTILPANTPVLLHSDGTDSYEWLPRVGDGDVVTDGNILKGTTETLPLESNTVLVLDDGLGDSEHVGFWLYDGTELPANSVYISDYPDETVYLPLPGYNSEVPTKIPSACVVQHSRQVYDLLGRLRSDKRQQKSPHLYKKGQRATVIVR